MFFLLRMLGNLRNPIAGNMLIRLDVKKELNRCCCLFDFLVCLIILGFNLILREPSKSNFGNISPDVKKKFSRCCCSFLFF